MVERFDLAALQFDPILRHGYRAEQPLEPDLVRVRAAIERADHLAWVFPTYWASPPTVVRGLVDRLLLPGWAFRFDGHALPTGLLRGRSARVITTMDSPAWWYRLMLRSPIHHSFGRATLPRRAARGGKAPAPPEGIALAETGHMADLVAVFAEQTVKPRKAGG